MDSTVDERSFFRCQEFCSLGPIRDKELRTGGQYDCSEAFDDENPAPAIVSSDTGHFCQGIGEELRPRCEILEGEREARALTPLAEPERMARQ